MLENTNNGNNDDSNPGRPGRSEFRADAQSPLERARSLTRTARRKVKKDSTATDTADYALAAANLFNENDKPLEELDALWIASDSFFFQKKYAEVLEVCKRGLEIADANYFTKYQAVMSYNFAWAFIELEQYENAKPYMAIAAEKYQELADLQAWGRAVSFQGRLELESHDFAQATDFFDKALDILSNTLLIQEIVDCHAYKLDCLINLDQISEAIHQSELLTHAIQHSADPSMESLPLSQLVLARLAIATENFDEAEARLQALKTKVQNENRPDWHLKVNLETARMQKAQGLFVDAAQLLEQVLGASTMFKNDIDPLEISVELITAYIGANNYIAATQSTQEAIDLAVKLNRLGLAEYFRLQQAIQYLDQGFAATALEILQLVDTQYWNAGDENMREYNQAMARAHLIESPEDMLLGS